MTDSQGCFCLKQKLSLPYHTTKIPHPSIILMVESCFNRGWGFSGSSVPEFFVNQTGTAWKCIRGPPLKFWTFIDWWLQSCGSTSKSSHPLHDRCTISHIPAMCRFWTRSNVASLPTKSSTADSAGDDLLTLMIPSEKDDVPLWIDAHIALFLKICKMA